jgi:hypothetical protein
MVGLDGIGTGGRPDLTNYLTALGRSPNVGNKAVPTEAIGQADTTTASTSDVAVVDQRSQVQQIVAEYDLHEVTPRDFSELVQRLYDAGAISDADRGNFALLRRELDAAGITPDESVDLFTLVEDRLDELRALAEENKENGTATASETQELAQQTATVLSQYEWLVKLDTIRQLGDSATLDQRA